MHLNRLKINQPCPACSFRSYFSSLRPNETVTVEFMPIAQGLRDLSDYNLCGLRLPESQPRS